ncbi:hypothetical protein [Calidithermus roseus]|uniref:Uncharacterized protein n=1 Tax=Calidithermus roseus TaxID=1644118 RepID=A0A399EZE2_9DEIN|nr:hypothetical protein [Calidithermus roseus]RIH89914.1 hypothetical protein Mrose_00139 [Calidithermus roseus]
MGGWIERTGVEVSLRWRGLVMLSALLLVIAGGALWLALQLGNSATHANLYSPQGLPLEAFYLCSNNAWSSLEATPQRAILQLVGIALLLPMPFLLVGAIAFLLYRSSRRNRRSQWEA